MVSIRILSGAVLLGLLFAGGLRAEETASVSASESIEMTAETAEISAAMKSVKGILDQRRSDTSIQKQKLAAPSSFLTDIDRSGERATAGKMFQGLAFCLGIFFIGSWFVRRFGSKSSGGADRRIRILERTALSAKSSVCLIEVDGRRVLLATGSEPVQVLLEDSRVSETVAKEQKQADVDLSLEVLCTEELKLSA